MDQGRSAFEPQLDSLAVPPHGPAPRPSCVEPFPHTALHCLAALMIHHRKPVTVERLIHDLGIPDAEPSAAYLVRIAKDHGFNARLDVMEWEELGRLGEAMPALLTLKNGRAVLLLGVTAETATVLDPLADIAAPFPVPRETFCQRWSGEVVLARPRHKLSDENQPFGLRWFIPEILRERIAFRDVAIAALVLHVLALATPLFFQLVIDRVLVHQSMTTLEVLGIGIVVALVFEAGFRFLRQYLLIFATQKIDVRVMKRTFAQLMRLPLELFERASTGVLTKHMQQSERIREFLTGRMLFAVLDLTALLVFLPILLFYSPKLAAMVLGISALIAAIIFAMIGPFRRRLADLYAAEGSRQALLVETIHGMRTVKSLAIEPFQRSEWDHLAASSARAGFRVSSLSALAQAVTELLDKLMAVAVIIVGSFDVFDGTMTVGALIAFQMLSGRVTGPLVQIVSLVHQYQETALSVRMLGTIMNQPPEPNTETGMAPKLVGRVGFEAVTFHYPGSVIPALDRLSVTIKEGTIFGIVGRSGSGKTTLTKLLQGLYPVQSGLIQIDGIDLREWDLAHLRRSTGVVLQESFLFRGSVRSNIAMTKPAASHEEVLRAAQLAGADEFIQRLPQGYDTPLDENANNLSGGQKQRLAIARALLSDPRLLILDEATSALDPESEAILQDNLRSIAEGRTLVIVSHRLSTLVQANNILVLDQGRAVGLDRHPALLESCEIYRSLWRQQTRFLG